MRVTEIATVRLQPQITSDSHALLSGLEKAKSVQEKGSGYPAYYFKDTSNPNIIYIIETWESVEKHMAFLPQKENQEVLGLMMPFFATDNPLTLKHVDMELKGQDGVGFVDWKEIGVVQYGVETKWKDEFDKWIEGSGGGRLLEKSDGFGGWSVEKDNEGEETLILLTKMAELDEILHRSLKQIPSRVPGGAVKWSSFKAPLLMIRSKYDDQEQL